MECTKQHRAALLHELEEARAKQELERLCLEKKAGGEDLTPWRDVGVWLADARVELIKQALLNNELDNY